MSPELTMRSSRFLACTLLLAAAPLFAQAPPVGDPAAPAAKAAPSAPAYAADPKFREAFQKAQLELKHRQVLSAEDDFKKASKLAEGKCVPCLMGLYDVQVMMGSFKSAVGTANALLQIADAPTTKAYAETILAQALMMQAGEKPKPAQLAAAHEAYQNALADYPKSPAALFGDGRVLARMGKMDEAKKEFAACAACVNPKDPARLRAQHFAEDPELSLHKMAPAFEVTALDGSKFNLDAMGGRVVLIDFWATWCGPCNEELPEMKKIAKEFAGQPLVILSVSWDADEAKWKQFIQKNEMTWMHYRDADHSLTREFGINSIPHYFTIDSDGVLTAEVVGSGNNVEGRLKKLVAKAREAHPAPAPATAPATTTSSN